MIKFLILCTENSSRSQMAEAVISSMNEEFKVYSAGIKPAEKINDNTVKVMAELGYDLSGKHPKSVNLFTNEELDYLITVCDDAKELCPNFSGKAKHIMHIGFEDPNEAKGNDEDVIEVYRKVRDEIIQKFYNLYLSIMTKEKSFGFIGCNETTEIILNAFNSIRMLPKNIAIASSDNQVVDAIRNKFNSVQFADVNIVAKQNFVFLTEITNKNIDLKNVFKKNSDENTVVISLIPELSMDSIIEKTGLSGIVRFMPNPGSLMNMGFNTICFSDELRFNDSNILYDLLGVLGELKEVEDEKFDTYNKIFNEGVAELKQTADNLVKQGVQNGLTEEESKEAVYKTLAGTLEVIFHSELNENIN
jgi:arsenate reductase (thioredoxin)